MWTWSDDHIAAMDYETSGARPEYALQPWRIPRGEARATSIAWVWPHSGRLCHAGDTLPDPHVTGDFLRWAIEEQRVVCGWNTPFDISVAMALGFRDLAMQVRWLDGQQRRSERHLSNVRTGLAHPG